MANPNHAPRRTGRENRTINDDSSSVVAVACQGVKIKAPSDRAHLGIFVHFFHTTVALAEENFPGAPHHHLNFRVGIFVIRPSLCIVGGLYSCIDSTVNGSTGSMRIFLLERHRDTSL